MHEQEYLRPGEKPNAEDREGSLFSRPMPTTLDGLLEFMLVAMLRKLGLDPAPEVILRILPTRYLVPDVTAAPVL